MLGGIERTVGTLAVRHSGPVGQCAPGLGDHLEIRLAETDGEPRFRAIAELESVFEVEAQVFFARHRRPIVRATPGKSHRISLSKNRPCYRMVKRIVAGFESRQSSGSDATGEPWYCRRRHRGWRRVSG